MSRHSRAGVIEHHQHHHPSGSWPFSWQTTEAQGNWETHTRPPKASSQTVLWWFSPHSVRRSTSCGQAQNSGVRKDILPIAEGKVNVCQTTIQSSVTSKLCPRSITSLHCLVHVTITCRLAVHTAFQLVSLRPVSFPICSPCRSQRDLWTVLTSSC